VSTTDFTTETQGGADPLTDDAVHALDDVADEAKDLARRAEARMGDAPHDTARQSSGVATDDRTRAAEQIAALAGAIGKAADELDKSGQAQFSDCARDAANGLEMLSSALRDRRIDDLAGGLPQLAGSDPAAFLSAAVLAGLAAGRFARLAPEGRGQGGQDETGASSIATSSPSYPDGDGSQTGHYSQGLGSSGDNAAWRSTGDYGQTERGH
jgi:hypothetical protein